jgi:hypothetical protein
VRLPDHPGTLATVALVVVKGDLDLVPFRDQLMGKANAIAQRGENQDLH